MAQKAIPFLFLLLLGCSAGAPVLSGVPANVMGRPLAAPDSSTWALSGYLHSDPGPKVYVTIRGNRILSVSRERPKVKTIAIVETGATIFPGFIDLSPGGPESLLPLWRQAISQFNSRLEWQNFPPYLQLQSAASLLQGENLCAAELWSEVKAVAGGAALTHPSCGEDQQNLQSLPAIVIPGHISDIFLPKIRPAMKEGLSYEAGYERLLDESKATAWIDFFIREPHTIGNALKLLIGNDFGFAATQLTPRQFDGAEPRIRRFLAGATYRLKGAEIDQQIAAMRGWIFGSAEEVSFLKSRKDRQTALAFLAKDGVLTIPAPVRSYAGLFEKGIRRPTLGFLDEPGPRAVVTPLAEGRRDDAFSSSEYQLARELGLARKGLVIKGSMALSEDELRDAATRNVSILWSPFSNLLLYGQTLDIAAAKAAGVNLALGSGPSFAGSKNILDELKIARRYLDRLGLESISNKDLVEMVTVNAAKALQREHELGAVQPGFLANLTLIHCPVAREVHDCVIMAGQQDITLVVANGHGLYGDTAPIRALARAFRDRRTPELLPRRTPASGAGCEFRKAIRFQEPGRWAAGQSVGRLQQQLIQALKGSPLSAPAPLFGCEDESYSRRFEAIVERELDHNLLQRESARSHFKLENGHSSGGRDREDQP
jgi:hypothetical protein